MRVANEARNDVPMQVWNHVAEAGEIDFVRLENQAHRLLDRKYHAHAMRTLRSRQVGEFLDVCAPDQAAVTGVIGIVDNNDATEAVAPDVAAAVNLTKHTGRNFRRR